MINSTAGIKIAIAVAQVIGPHFTPCSVINVYSPIDIGWIFVLEVRVMAMTNSFQQVKNVMTEVAITPGIVSGNNIFVNVPNVEQPSINAASSNSLGMES